MRGTGWHDFTKDELVPGQQLFSYRGDHRGMTQKVTILRVTATQIILTDGKGGEYGTRYRRVDGERVGRTSGGSSPWSSFERLLPLDDPYALRGFSLTVMNAYRVRVEKAAASFEIAPTTETFDKLTELVTRWGKFAFEAQAEIDA
jgi:hypothetical protein